MQRTIVGLLAVALMLMAVPASATDMNVREKNIDFLVDYTGLEEIPDGEAMVHQNGEATELSIETAFELAAERAGSADLAQILSAAEPGDAVGVGDVWILEFGVGDCPEVTTHSEEAVVPPGAYDAQFAVYDGPVGNSTSSGAGSIIDWTTKDAAAGTYTDGVSYAGQSDFFCIAFFGIYLLFPFLDGVAASN